MKKLIVLASLVCAAFAQNEVKQLSDDELQGLLREKVILLDVRPPEEIAQRGTLKGYVNIPIDELEKRMGELPKDKRIVTACGGGGRAARAGAMLKAKGYNVVGACGLEGNKDLELIYPKPADSKPKK